MLKRCGRLTEPGGADRSGFTLTELLVAMGLAMFVLAGVVILYSTSNRSYVKQDKMVAVEQNVRSAMEIMAHELRMAGYIPMDSLPDGPSEIRQDVPGEAWTDGSPEQLEEATATAITFISDLNADNIPETIRYALSGTTLTRQAWQYIPGTNTWQAMTGSVTGSINLAENIQSITISYTFENGAVGIPSNVDASLDNDREDVRAITIAMTGLTRTPVEGTVFGTRTLQSYVKLRNLGLETSTH